MITQAEEDLESAQKRLEAEDSDELEQLNREAERIHVQESLAVGLEQRPMPVPDFSGEGDNFFREDDDDSDIKVIKENFKILARSLRKIFVVDTKK